MKLYIPTPVPPIVKISIKKPENDSEFLTFSDITREKCFEFIKTTIESQHISPFAKGNSVSIEVLKGKEKGETLSLSFKGMEPKEVRDLLVLTLENREEAQAYLASLPEEPVVVVTRKKRTSKSDVVNPISSSPIDTTAIAPEVASPVATNTTEAPTTAVSEFDM